MPGTAEYGDVLANVAVAGNVEVGGNLQIGNRVEIGVIMTMPGKGAEEEGVDVFFPVLLGGQADVVQNQGIYGHACGAFVMKRAVQMQGCL